MTDTGWQAVVIGSSSGGLAALTTIAAMLPADFHLPVAIVQHRQEEDATGYLPTLLEHRCVLPVREAMDKEPLVPGTITLAPPGYHLLIERSGTYSLSVDAPVNFARPAIDVLFESAATAFGAGLLGIILTGANQDGSHGIQKIKAAGGTTIAQDPAEAEADTMPRSAIATAAVDHVLTLHGIGTFLAAAGQPAAARNKNPHPRISPCL